MQANETITERCECCGQELRSSDGKVCRQCQSRVKAQLRQAKANRYSQQRQRKVA